MLYKKIWSLFHVQLSESERIEMTPTPNNWEGDDGMHSKEIQGQGVARYMVMEASRDTS